MKKIIILVFFFCVKFVFGQEEYKCNVKRDSLSFVNMPHYDNNAILNDIKSIISKAKKSQKGMASFTSNNYLFNIPVKIWIFNDDNGSNQATTEALVNKDLEEVNEYFEENNISIRFYKKCVIENVNNTQLNIINSDSEFNSITSSYRDEKALNWIYIDDVDYADSNDNWGAKATWPEANVNFTFVTQTGSSSVISHEIGHCFGLLHTHETARSSGDNGGAGDCYQESVSRSKTQGLACVSTIGKKKCEVNGDALCDTEASPGSISVDVSSCIYSGIEKDNWGATFIPQADNFMAYTDDWCRTSFTSNQISSMYNHIALYMAIDDHPLLPPGIDGDAFYNKNIIAIEGSSNSGDNEEYISPEFIQVDDYTANNGSMVNLIAQSQVKINPGVHIKAGSIFSVKAQEITSCNSITTSSKGQSKSQFISNSEENEVESQIIELYLASKVEKTLVTTDTDSLINNFSVFPNPAESIVNITFYSIFNSIASIEIRSITGKVLLSKEINSIEGVNNTVIDINELAKGVYLVEVSIPKEGKKHQSKLIKE